ncbi:protein kinase domain-containing protein [Pseudobutyrivibrio xylanivorans]|uniref:Protein kinase n=1 Tax=Pseudobutyrivibrio xylanivorans TaxID=185007 RepID=A0A5P6VU49_PSEXY|nr:protein kinase [Pseudobutyrivibrio xylanivorans]QFJ55279.1 protein kinase [Pseudobutyrivibrio xylanivorans]
MNQQYEDIYGNVFSLDKELSSGGQGIVYKTKEPNVLLKIEWNPQTKRINLDVVANEKFDAIRLLPIPSNTNITLPQSVLKDCVGYSMRMLDDMISFEEAFRYGDIEYRNAWLESFGDSNPEFVKGFGNYISTGGKRRRIAAFLKVAGILSTIHARGLVYCDLSDKNMYISSAQDRDVVWMIDVDNINFITVTSKRDGIFSPGYVAPEILKGKGNTFYSDIFSFAIALFWNLTGQHPYVGPQLEDKLEEEDFLSETEETFACGCDVEWIRDDEDDSNYSETPIPYDLLVGEKLNNCFKRTFSRAGRHKRLTRPTMIEWGEALAYELDNSIKCHKCEMEYNPTISDTCPWCDEKNTYVSLSCKGVNGENPVVTHMQEIGTVIKVPLRLINGFSVSELDDVLFEIESSKKEVVIRSFNNHFDFECSYDGIFQRIFGKCVIDRDTQIKVTDKSTGEKYLVDYVLKG